MTKFLGARVTRLLAVSILAGLCLSVVEVAFSVLIQSFLLSLGVLDSASSILPGWAPRAFEANLVALIVFAFLRGSIQWFKVYSHSMTNEAFAYHMKRLITSWSLSSADSRSSQVVTLINDRVAGVANFITGFQNAAILTLSMSFVVVYLFKAAAFAAAVGLGALLFFGLLLRLLDRRIKSSGTQIAAAGIRINDRLLDAMKNLHYLKISRAEKREAALIRADLDSYFASVRSFTQIKSWKFASPQFIGVLVIALIAAYSKKTGVIAGGAFLSFVYLFVRCSQTLSDLSTAFATIRMYRPQFDELFGWWKKHEAEIEALAITAAAAQHVEDARPLPPLSFEFNEVTFNYADGAAVFPKQTFHTPERGLTVISGPSGTGKSTLLHLIGGLLTEKSGAVRAGSAPVTEVIAKGGLRFGYVGPDPYVINGTVRANLLYGLNRSPSDTEITRALELAHCREFLPNLPADLNRELNDRGEGLSTGQKQRLALARAILRNPNVLLLDEPTANLDQESAAKVIEALRTLKRDLSIVVVTHHGSLVEAADHVVKL